ncbi:DUF5993 family protein [Paralcaligenes ginsengisoli]
MIMMLPFLTGIMSIWFGIRGQRRACLWFWLLSSIIFLAWCKVHMNDPLILSL